MIRATLMSLGLLAMVFAACSQGPTDSAGTQLSGADDQLGAQAPDTILPPPQYPLAVGNMWTYEGEAYNDNFDPPEIEDEIGFFNSIVSKVTVECMEILPNEVEAARLVEVSFLAEGDLTPPDSTLQISWLTNDKKTLLFHGYEGNNLVGATPSKQSPSVAINDHEFPSINHLWAAMLGHDSERRESWFDPPREALQFYNLRVGNHWTYVDSMESGLQIEKHCTGFDFVDTPDGAYLAWTITWKYIWAGEDVYDDSIEIVDIIGYEGLISREFHAFGVGHATEGGGYLGTCDYHQHLMMTGRGLLEKKNFF